MLNKKTSSKLFERKQIVEYFYNKSFGETVEFEELQDFTHYNLKDEFENSKFKQNLMPVVKNDLLKKGYILQSIRKVGYYILKPNQIQSFTYRNFIKKPLKKYEKAQTILNKTIKRDLTNGELLRHQLTEKLTNELIIATSTILDDEEYMEIAE